MHIGSSYIHSHVWHGYWKSFTNIHSHVDDLAQDWSNSSVSAMELLQSSTKLSFCMVPLYRDHFVWCLFSTKPLPMLAYCQLDSWKQISVKFELEFCHFHSRKFIWKCCLPKWWQFIPRQAYHPNHVKLGWCGICVVKGDWKGHRKKLPWTIISQSWYNKEEYLKLFIRDMYLSGKVRYGAYLWDQTLAYVFNLVIAMPCVIFC